MKAKFSRALQPSRANKFTSIKQENIKVGFHFLKVHFFGVIRDTTNTLEVINMWDIGENGRRSGLALTDEQVGKTGRGGLLFYDIEVLTIQT